MRINAYLNFSGECEAAFKHYEKCLGGRIVMMMDSSNVPGCDQIPEERKKWIMHARLMVGDQVLMGSDSPPEYYDGTKGMYVCIGIDDVAKAKGVFDALGEGGAVTMPFEPTFFAEGFGMLGRPVRHPLDDRHGEDALGVDVAQTVASPSGRCVSGASCA